MVESIMIYLCILTDSRILWGINMVSKLLEVRKTALWDKYVGRFEEVGGSIFPRWFSSLEGAVLDVGCGYGKFLASLRKARLKVGLEISAVALKRGKELYHLENLACGSATDLPFKKSTFNYVTLIEVIEHLHDPQKLLEEARRVLKPSGYLLIKTPNYPFKRFYDLKQSIVKNRTFRMPPDDLTHYSPFSWRKLNKILKSHFQDVRLLPFGIVFENRLPSSIRTVYLKMFFMLSHKIIAIAKK